MVGSRLNSAGWLAGWQARLPIYDIVCLSKLSRLMACQTYMLPERAYVGWLLATWHGYSWFRPTGGWRERDVEKGTSRKNLKTRRNAAGLGLRTCVWWVSRELEMNERVFIEDDICYMCVGRMHFCSDSSFVAKTYMHYRSRSASLSLPAVNWYLSCWKL